MKKIIFTIILLSILKPTFGQVASDYFPAQTGYKWNYEFLPLDSLNNIIDSLKFYGVDSFFVSAPFNGKEAKIVLTKTGARNTVNLQPYLDSLFYSFDGSNGFEYFNPFFLSDLIGSLDSTLGINFFNFFRSLEGWYSYYRFASQVNQNYTVFSKDTTVTINSTTLPLRFQLIGKRLDDETITTEIGNFTCKKFLLERRLSYLVSIPPLPTIAIKILGVEETVWLAPSHWKVKSYIPSTRVDLSIAGGPVFSIPGLETNVKNPITSANDLIVQPELFKLYQNFPNPFNPRTKISWQSLIGSWQTLKVYDVLGKQVATLVDEYRDAGSFEAEFNAVNLASGIYYYQLKAGDFIETRKMILLK